MVSLTLLGYKIYFIITETRKIKYLPYSIYVCNELLFDGLHAKVKYFEKNFKNNKTTTTNRLLGPLPPICSRSKYSKTNVIFWWAGSSHEPKRYFRGLRFERHGIEKAIALLSERQFSYDTLNRERTPDKTVGFVQNRY